MEDAPNMITRGAKLSDTPVSLMHASKICAAIRKVVELGVGHGEMNPHTKGKFFNSILVILFFFVSLIHSFSSSFFVYVYARWKSLRAGTQITSNQTTADAW